MPLPVRILPIVERWQCTGCGACCRGTIVPLDEIDLARLRQQHWDKHPDFRGLRIVVRQGLWGGRFILGRRDDGNCVFLQADGLCRIHAELGEPAKPLTCRLFPLQVARLEEFAYLTTRRYCPEAAADRGQPLAELVGTYQDLARQRPSLLAPGPPPMITSGVRRGWKDALRVADVVERLLVDGRYPPVRRLVHAAQFARLLGQCRLRQMPTQPFAELLAMLGAACVEHASAVFAERRPPGRTAASLFRQIAFELLRLHPKYAIRRSWIERWRLLRAAVGFARGKGEVPFLHACFPPTTFAQLDRPLGPLGEDILRPLSAYFEATALSRHYLILGRTRWPLVDSIRALALSHALAMWLLRLTCGSRQPGAEDVIDVVAAIDRAQGSVGHALARHRRRLLALDRLGELDRLVAWYAR